MDCLSDEQRRQTRGIGVQILEVIFRRFLTRMTATALSVFLFSLSTANAQAEVDWSANGAVNPQGLVACKPLELADAVGIVGDSFDVSNAVSPPLSYEAPELVASQDGLIVERQRWSFGGVNGFAWRARTALPGRIRVVPSSRVSRFDYFIPNDQGPWAVINGGFYDVDGKAMGVVVADSQTFSPFRRGGGSGVFEVTELGPRIIHRNVYEPGAIQALQSIDRIIDEGRSLVNRRANARSTARSAVVITDEELIFVVVAQDGSISGKGDDVRLGITSRLGLPLWAFSDYLLSSTGARAALNLDGSVSTQFAARLSGRDVRVRGVRGTVNALIMRPN